MPRRQSTFSEALLQKGLGTAYRQIREERDESQEDVAFNAKVHLTTYGNIERGNRNPTFHVQARIVQALETNFAQVGALLDSFLEDRQPGAQPAALELTQTSSTTRNNSGSRPSDQP